MRRLILFRHGKAEAAGLTGGDRERPLAQRGRTEGSLTAQWLRACGFSPDLVLLSPSVRTRATWACAEPLFPAARVEVRESLYLADAETIQDELAITPEDARVVMVVGHNPGLQELGLQLASEGDAPDSQILHLSEGFPTATACVFCMRGDRGPALAAIYEPPRQEGEAPRWAFYAEGMGETD
jgi:phosphohistidine phosphatase